MQKVIFRNCDESSPYWSELEDLFQSEWSDFKFKDTYEENVNLPPVITVLRDNVVIGGLAYSYFQEPHKVRDVVWVNAVYVDSQWRGQGIASELIKRAVAQMPEYYRSQPQSLKDSTPNLYAYTNIAPLYLSLGWSIVEIATDPNHHVMSVSF
ncbi:GNAT family N-acetyltransferase [Vibrio crassostreae]|uniref:GNAT family N-acetyltransferase n=1 Tax=Vibrio crassostreae TaxID=246167 RepID=UPI000635622C|nr:GNAT family N-acetyltransferase [Vibrio crassostreae]ROP22961.1 N-acetylglutamate synthase-like GNAT family acetyltransferase [Vibrio crassostreae]ROP23599.1 N-acetylglutamate synthase-like GNAT family acetyltransferase [Vibrio crassostreae]RPE98817.1 N-acetylglutamate synthase-like GNAT family acetyltransferase [Vibrio crassostreae]TCN74188.1 N-acetylglutamate synthase-like GNAT family acetyltransferase [Vibrio crassostreae]TCT56409.1 N-acetylglutamate synthase-like GNAT family acetyltrans